MTIYKMRATTYQTCTPQSAVSGEALDTSAASTTELLHRDSNECSEKSTNGSDEL